MVGFSGRRPNPEALENKRRGISSEQATPRTDLTGVPASMAVRVRQLAPGAWRRLPPTVRRWWRRPELFNRATLWLGAPPVTQAHMNAGHRLLLDLRSGAERLAYYTGEFDTGRVRAAQALLQRQPGGIAVDAGANIGLWTVPLTLEASRTGACVLAFEPVPHNAERLRQNLLLNDVAGHAEVRQHALSDRPETLSMTLREDFAAGARTGNAAVAIGDGTDNTWSRVEVAAETLDDVLDGHGCPPVRVVKADLEGHEDRFLTGAQRTFARDRPVAFVEFNRVYYDRRGMDPADATETLLREWDYRCLRLRNGTWQSQTRFDSDRPLDDLILVPLERQVEVIQLLVRHVGGS
jgi:FkbM family methyltransferase